MKIQKIRLTEADENIIDPQEASTAEIADEIQEVSDETVSDEVAKEAAKDIKDAGKTLNAETAVVVDEDEPLEMDNKLTRALEQAFKANKKFKRRHINEVANVLVSGLPGSSKTASVYNWGHFKTINGEPVNITYINAKNNDLDAFINGYTIQDPEDKLFVTQAISRNLDGLDRPNSILFIDEYNRQTKQQIRASLLTLINEHYVVGKGEGGKHYFPNFLFTVAAINPAVGIEDEGAAELNDAEKSRFLIQITDFDSDPEITKNYLQQAYIDKKVKKMLKNADLTDPEVLEDLEAYLRIVDLGTFILNHEDFSYDTKNDLSALYNNRKNMVNQRTFTAGLALVDGDADGFRTWAQEESNFLDKDIDMFNDILDEYSSPTTESLFKKYGINLNNVESPEPAPVALEEPEEEEKEDDEDFFQKTPTGTTGVDTPQGVFNKVSSAINSQI